MEETRFARLLEMADEIDGFRFCDGHDSDESTACTYAFKGLAKRFVGAARRVGNQLFRDAINKVNTDIDDLYGAFDLRSDLVPLIDDLRELAEHPESCEWSDPPDLFVEPAVIDELQLCDSKKFDLSKIVHICNELNSSYDAKNYMASSLLIRTLLNHVPPVFGQSSFNQVVSQSPKSLKTLLEQLEQFARPVADIQAHQPISQKANVPTKSQVEPFKASLEVLLQEIIRRVPQAGQ